MTNYLLPLVVDPTLGEFEKEILKFTLLGQSENHHSDDFLEFLNYLSAGVLATFDNTYFYANSQHMSLKFETNTGCSFPDSLSPDVYLGKIAPADILRYGLKLGTDSGLEYSPDFLIKPVTLYSPGQRLARQFKSVYTEFEFTDEHPEGVVKPGRDGATFLQQKMKHLPRYEIGEDGELRQRANYDGTFIIPMRLYPRLLAKMFYSARRELTPPETLVKLISFAFHCPGNEPLYDCLRDIFDEYKQLYSVAEMDLASVDFADKQFNDWKYKLGEIDAAERVVFPSYLRVMQFFSVSEDKQGKQLAAATRVDRANYPGFDYLKVNRPRKLNDLIVDHADLRAEALALLRQFTN